MAWPIVSAARVAARYVANSKVGRAVGWGLNRPGAVGKRGKNAGKFRHVPGSHAPLRNLGTNVLDRGWQAESAIQSVRNVTKEWLPQTALGVTVRVVGNPQSNMTNIFYLACSIATNANPDLLGGARSHVFSATIIPHLKMVVVSIAHSAGGLFGGGGASGRTAVKGFVPDNYNAEKNWPLFMTDIVDARGLSNEPFATTPTCNNQIVATMLTAANPVPQLDGISRQSDLTALVSAALLGACDPVPCPKTDDYAGSPAGATKRSSNPPLVTSAKTGPVVNTTKLDTLKLPSSATAVPQTCDESKTTGS